VSQSSIELIIFDCDGVLIDSEAIANQVCVEHLAAIGLSMTMRDFAGRYAGSQIRDIWRRVGEDIGRPVPETLKRQIDEEIHRRLADELKAMDGVFEVLGAISARRCVASSTGLVKLRKNLGLVGLLDLFEPCIFSASQVARGKPAPDVFLYAASQMGEDPLRCLVIEDSLPGIEAAKRAGMKAIGFAGGGHVLPDHAQRLSAAGAISVAASMAELSPILREYL
jgi:HAD superfamily hydrolase (TIGR01509 family)